MCYLHRTRSLYQRRVIFKNRICHSKQRKKDTNELVTRHSSSAFLSPQFKGIATFSSLWIFKQIYIYIDHNIFATFPSIRTDIKTKMGSVYDSSYLYYIYRIQMFPITVLFSLIRTTLYSMAVYVNAAFELCLRNSSAYNFFSQL